MIERNIFIGLGGSGVNTVATLKYKIYANLSADNPLEVMNQNYRFLFCDTDQADVKKQNAYYKSKFEGGRRLFIDSENDLINLGAVNPMAVHSETKAKAASQRSDIDNVLLDICTDRIVESLKPYPLSDGAGAFRANSHIAMAQVSSLMVNKLREAITQMLDVNTAGNEEIMLRYWIVGSSNGGTGSGTFMDVLYWVNMLHKVYRRNEEPKTTLVMYMPRFYIDANHGETKYSCNAHAVFSEMDGFQYISRKGDSEIQEMLRQTMFTPDNLNIEEGVTFRPFYSCIPIDLQTERGNSLLSNAKMYSNTAEMLYFVHQSKGRDPLASSFKSDADNYVDDILVDNPLNYLQPMGYVALRKPEKEFENYVEHRLKLDILSYGVLFAFPEDLNLEKENEKFYESIIGKELFSLQEGTFSKKINDIVEKTIKTSFSDNLIKVDGKPRKSLSAGISRASADLVVSKFNMAIDDLYTGDEEFAKGKVLKRLEDNIWSWVEEQTLERGLNYVKQVLDGVDLYAAEILKDYLTGNDNEGVSALTESVNSIVGQLEGLRKKAEEITFKERLPWNSNAPDVRNYFNQLKEYIKVKGKLAIVSKQCELLAELCKGDNGILDNIRFYVGELKTAAEKNARIQEQEYHGLAQFFGNSVNDITTVYLPDISKFINKGTWDSKNYFSRLYGNVLSMGNKFIQGYGFIPMRTCSESQEKSVQGFLNKLIESNKKELIDEGYYWEGDGNNYSMLFRRNRNSENPSKVIEDLLGFVMKTYEKQYKQSQALTSLWYGLSLEDMFMQLTYDEQQAVSQKLSPQLFYSYKSGINQGREFNYVIAPSEQMAEKVFRYQRGNPGWRYDQSSSYSVAYMLRAKVGLPLSSYMLYDTISTIYRNEVEKTIYHTHPTWGLCNGDYTKLRFEPRAGHELIAFGKYMLLNEYVRVMGSLFYVPTDLIGKNNYRQTPMAIEKNVISFALPEAIDVIQEDIALHGNHFVEYMAADESLLYKNVYTKFKNEFVANRHAIALAKLIKLLSEISEFKHKYNEVKKSLVDSLNELWVNATKNEEKKMLERIVHLFDEGKELSEYEKFEV